MKKHIHKNKIYVLMIAIASIAFGSAYGVPLLQDSQTKLIESIQALPSDSIERAQLQKTLLRLVETELKQRFEKQEAELKQIEKRLEDAKAKLNQRKDKRSEIVERRVFDLLQKRDELDWASATENQNIEVLSTSPKATQSVSQAKSQSEGLNRLSDSVTATEQRAAILKNTNSNGELAAKVLENIFDALKLQAMLEEEFSGLTDEKKREKAVVKTVESRMKLLELKFDLMQKIKEPSYSLFEAELSVRESSYLLAQKEFEISSQLVKVGAESTKENNRKKAAMDVEQVRLSQTEKEFQYYKDQLDSLRERVRVVRKKLR